ncbi:MAG: Zeta toxin protein, partial [Patescibacteria group bacterium]|nr:Zeta toxin protein [Patescibacteria group bacterium]
KGFIKRFADAPIRIDADEIRSFCPGYDGANASLFQKAANKE